MIPRPGRCNWISAALLALTATASLHGTEQADVSGIAGKPAPRWDVDAWFNLPEGKERLDVTDFRGKVVYLYCFQSW